jgi:hypothetical protein
VKNVTFALEGLSAKGARINLAVGFLYRDV